MLDPDNRLFVLARQGQRQPPALVAVAVTVAVLVVAIIGGQVAGRILIPRRLPGRDAVELALGFLPIYVCLWAWLALWSKRPFWTLGLERIHPVGRWLGGAAVATAMMAAVAAVLGALPNTVIEQGELRSIGLSALPGGILALVATAVQASGEELLFRGWLLPSIGARYQPWTGVIVSSALFGLAHSLNPHATALGILNLSLFGAFLALYALKEGGLWGACAWHTVWNWVEGNGLGLSDSGAPIRSGLFVSMTPAGPDILTGGAFGPDGGLIQTAVQLAGIAVLVAVISRQTQTAGR